MGTVEGAVARADRRTAGPTSRSGEVDRAVAVVAGPAYWGWRPTSAEGLAGAAGQVTMLAVLCTAATARALDTDGGPVVLGAVAMVLATWATAACWAAVGLRLGRSMRPLPLLALLRLALLVVLVGLWGAAQGGRVAMLELWPLGAAVGLEASMSLRAVGVDVHGRDALLRIGTSGAHVGVVLGLLVVVALAPAGFSATTALWLYAGVAVNVVVAVVASSLLTRVARRADAARAAGRAEEARQRANWIHDEVCGLLLPIRQDVRSGAASSSAQVLARLDALDHELRQAQLALAGEHHRLSVADVVQPWARRIRQHGVRVVPPPWEVAQARLGDADRYRLGRVLGVAVPNALAAGARTIRVQVRRHGVWALSVTVTDDAGGLGPDAILPGRGLHRLLEEFGNQVEVAAIPGGTRVTTVVTEVGR